VTEAHWRSGLVASVAIHAIVGALLFMGFSHTVPMPPSAPAAMAIQIMPEPAAPPQTPHQTPVGPQQQQSPPKPTPKPIDKIPPVPTVAQVHADVAVPPKQQTPPAKEQPRLKQEADKTTAPSAPSLPPKPIAAAPVQGVSSATTDRAEQTWEGLVLAKLERKKRYPWDAQRAGQQDIVYVHVTVDRSGKVLNAAIDHSKHFALLDSAVLDLVRHCSPLPQPPSSVPGDTVDFVVPIDFFIKQSGH
jgi:protein TonB